MSFLLKSAHVTEVREPLEFVINTSMRNVLALRIGEWTNHAFASGSDGFQNKVAVVLLEPNPNMPPRLVAVRLPNAADQLGLVSEFDKFSPRPDRVILAIAFTQVLECARVLPKVGLVEQCFIVRVLAFEQPFANLVRGCYANLAFTLEVPWERSIGTAAERL